ncbi:MAG: hypothetical protein HQL21_01285 [Candidatus Omnitrophica bacterium]|nr:hypothetical protein [Candidatus Omnitrophota bacterium]
MRITGKRNESGIVLIAVVAFIVVVSVMILGIMSRNASQTVSVEEQVRHIQAEQLRKGAMWVAKAKEDRNEGLPETIIEKLGDGKDFSIYFSKTGRKTNINVSY